VDEVVAVEPEPYLRTRAQQAAGRAPVCITVTDGTADRLPFEGASFDAAVASLVLCSVPEQEPALAELRRVLKPGAELRFFEHVRSPSPRKARVQQALDSSGIWPLFVGGCHCGRDTRAAIEASGGKVLGAVKHPLNTADFSSFLLQAQNSKAKVVALANAGGDTINSIKQASEFGIVKGGQNLAGLLVFISDVHALGLQTAQGLIFTETFYWDRDDASRAFAKRFAPQYKGNMPTMVQAGVYSAVLHYLKAVEALKSDEGPKVIAKMKEMPTDDPLFGKGRVRADGRKIHDAYLVEVKKPDASKYPWDYYKILTKISGDDAFGPPDPACGLVKK
jgi:hypothetical protein